MKFHWEVEESDRKFVQHFVQEHATKNFVRERILRNVEGPAPEFDRAKFWRGMVMCLLTTQQKAGPESSVTRFLNSTPFPLGLDVCASECSGSFFEEILTNHGGIRRTRTIGEQLEINLRTLETGGWEHVAELARRLAVQRGREPRTSDKTLERHACMAVDDGFEGIGPKQSRNLWQHLGFTRYEIPLDSRIIKWLKKAEFPLPVSATPLSDPSYYDFVLDGVQLLAKESDVLPCILDAAVFASFDPDWKPNTFVN